MMQEAENVETQVEEATFDFAMGEAHHAIEKLEAVVSAHPDSFKAWHALAEIHYSEKRFKEALAAAEKAHALDPQDLFINTSLSRIWLELGSKEKAEHFGAQAKVQTWKEQLRNPDATSDEGNLA